MTLLAKSRPPRSLEQHTLDVWAMVRQYAERWPHLAALADAPELFEDAAWAALWHDLGKAAAGFQAQLHGREDVWAERWQGYRHEILSGALVAACPPSARAHDVLLAVMTHHLGLNREAFGASALARYDPRHDTSVPFAERLRQLEAHWEELRALIASLRERVPSEDLALVPALPESPAALPDPFERLRREKRKVRSRRSRGRVEKLNLKRVFLRGLLVAADHLASAAAAERPSEPAASILPLPQPKRLTPESFPFELHSHQRRCARAGSILLDAPTGSGKTEAALLWAEANQNAQRGQHLFYLLPYTASINAMYRRLRAQLGEEAVSLLHGRSSYFVYRWLCEAGEEPFAAMAQAKKLRQQTRELYYPVKVLTPHQVLMAFLGVKGWERAWCEYAGGLFVLDEIHAYEPRLLGLLCEMLRRLTQTLGAKVCLMSATFPSRLRERLQACLGLCAHVQLSPDDRARYSRHRVRVVEGSVQDQGAEIVRRLKEGQRVLLVLNTVDGARQAYEAFRAYARHPCLLHGRLTLADRQRAEALLDRAATPSVDLLVGTQAIEVSLDVDFDVLFSDPAPLDALLQRMGRVNRKPVHVLETLAPEERFKDVFICCEQWPETYPIYAADAAGERLVAHSLEALARDEVLHEDRLLSLLDSVYNEEQMAPTLSAAEETARRLAELIGQLEPGSECERDELDLLDRMIDAVYVVPARFKEAHEQLIAAKRFFQAQEYLLPISRGRYHALKRNDQVYRLGKHLYGLFHYEPGMGPDFERRVDLEDNVL